MKTKSKLVFSTNNQHKLDEVQAILQNHFDVLSLKDINCDVDVEETATTLEGNALIKARYIWDNYQMACFGDDTGLEVEALNNEPGVYSARYAGESKNAKDNVAKLLRNLIGVENRSARFRTVIALIDDAGNEHLFEGVVKGEIIKENRGNSGFGYDPVFVPDGYNQTFAELGDDVKNKISHRALAVNKLSTFLNTKE